jgi:hypothetical protein
VTDANGAVRTLAYNDPLDRLTGVTDPAGTTAYGYDATPK